MAYEYSWLWKSAFVDERDDVTGAEQTYFRERYLAMRAKAAMLVGRIGADMKDMTVHDVTHLDALWEMGSIVTKGEVTLNPPEAFVFGGALLLHDAAMSLAAYEDGIAGLKQEIVWQDSYARLNQRARDEGRVPDEDTEKLATAEALRGLHAKQAERLVKMSWQDGSGPEEYLIDDHELRRFYGPKIGKIAHSHWWDIAKVEDEFAVDLGALGGRTEHRIDLMKIACLLRISDAMHLDRRRAPSFLRLLVQPEGISAAHWKFQERMAVPFIDKGALIYSAAQPFELDDADAWWLAYDAISMVDHELRAIDQLLQRRDGQRLLASRVEGAAAPEELSTLVETEGWKPVNTAIRVSDVPKIVSMLGGTKLYGDKPEAAVRELIQNAADAIQARRKLQRREDDWGSILVALEQRGDETWLAIEDTGVGMSQAVLTGPLIDFGNSLWRSPLAGQEFPGLQATGLEPTGRYGIGFFSVFMLGDFVRVITRRYNQANEDGGVLEFAHGLGSRPIFYRTAQGTPIDGGTRIEVKLNSSPWTDGGLLWRNSWSSKTDTLNAFVAAIAPALDVRIETIEKGRREVAVEASDWLTLKAPYLYNRLAKDTKSKADANDDTRLRSLVGPDGEIYGRARIECASWGSGVRGCLSIGGLRASSADIFSGLIRARERTAARDDAVLAVPPEVLKSWADEQALLLAQSAEDGEDKARGANAILACGGEVDRLPIVRLGETWLKPRELAATIQDLSEIFVVFDDPLRFEEDEDNVHPKDFKDRFERNENVFFVINELPGFSSQDKLFARLPVETGEGRPRSIAQLFRHIVGAAWGEFEADDIMMEVGEVDGTEIIRTAKRLLRPEDD